MPNICVSYGFSHRPPNTALGQFAALLPVVVICNKIDDAVTIVSIADELVRGVDHRDAHTLMYRSQNLAIDIVTDDLYCIRAGKHETGIWIGFSW